MDVGVGYGRVVVVVVRLRIGTEIRALLCKRHCHACCWQQLGHACVGEGSRVPEVNRLGADGRVPEPGEAGGLSARCGRGIAAGVELCEVGAAEGAEDAGAGAERHGDCVSTVGGWWEAG